MVLSFEAGMCLFTGGIFLVALVVFVIDQYVKHKEREHERVMANKDITMEERKIIHSHVKQGGHLPNKREMGEIEDGRYIM